MAKFKNVSPLGALDIPALRRVVQAGETFDVPADLVEHFKDQPGTFKRVGGSAAPAQKATPKSKAATAAEKTKGGEYDNAA